MSSNIQLSILGYTITLFAPTLLLNSSMWGQCDIIYTFFIISCLYYFLIDKPLFASIMFGIAFTFKLQAIFFAPFLIVLWLKDNMKLRHFLCIPAVYIISIIPAWISGRPLMDLILIYLNQSESSNLINRGAPNIYSILEGTEYSSILTIAGLATACTVILLLLYFIWHTNCILTKQSLILFACLISVMIPFFLPRMHERYFFMADVLSIIFLFYYPRKFYIPLLINIASLISYIPFLFKITHIPLYIATTFMGIALVSLVITTISFLHTSKEHPSLS